MSRRQSVDAILAEVGNYLETAGWTMNAVFMQWEDPISGLLYRTDFAFVLQTDRDLKPIATTPPADKQGEER